MITDNDFCNNNDLTIRNQIKPSIHLASLETTFSVSPPTGKYTCTKSRVRLKTVHNYY